MCKLLLPCYTWCMKNITEECCGLCCCGFWKSLHASLQRWMSEGTDKRTCKTEGLSCAFLFKRFFLSSCSFPLSCVRNKGRSLYVQALTTNQWLKNVQGHDTNLEASSFCCSRILCWASQVAFSSSNTRLFSSSSLYCASKFLFICSWRRSS